MDAILSDTSKFQLLNEDPVKVTLQRENQVKSLLKKLKAANSLNEKTYSELYPTGSRIDILYSLPKIHKSTIPLRPILSSVNHYSYKLAKFFIPLLTPLTTSSFIITDSFSFVQELLNSDIDSSNVVMASFDVTSLFTNIPVNETIDIICNSLFSNCQFFNGLDRSEFQKLLSLSVMNCHFIFNGRLYQQVDGMAMGSPLVPLFANVFMSFHEHIWLQNCPSSFTPVLYRRYVDDCFLLFRSLNHVPLFLKFLNQQHPNITLVVLDGLFGLFSTRRPRGAPFPRAMRVFDVIFPVPHPPECVDRTRCPRGAPNNEPNACVVSHTLSRNPRVFPTHATHDVTLGPRVFPTHAIHDVIIPHANKKHENDVIKYYFFNKSRNNMFFK